MTGNPRKIEPLVLHMSGNHITAEEFLKAVNSFFGMLTNVSEEVAEQRNAITWIVSAKSGSLVIVANPEPCRAKPEVLPKVVRAIHSGIKSLEKRDTRPRYFTDTALRHAKILGSIADEEGKIFRIQIRDDRQASNISKHTLANVDSILGTSRSEWGSVEGRVSMLTDRGRLEVYIDDILTGHAVRCIVSPEKEGMLISAFRKRVIIDGDVHYRRDGKPISIEVNQLRILGGKKSISFEDVRGIYQR